MSKRLEQCKEVWMRAALENRRQFHVAAGEDGLPQPGSRDDLGTEFTGRANGMSECAGTIMACHFVWLFLFRCPDHLDEQGYPIWHFNNLPHKWDWLQLARKLGEHPYEEVGG